MKILKLLAERPKEYKKGPSVMSKSARTQRCYEKAFRGQGKLTGFGFKALQYDPHLQLPSGPGLLLSSKQSDSDTGNLNQLDQAAQPLPRILAGFMEAFGISTSKIGHMHIQFDHVPIAKIHLLTVATMRRTYLQFLSARISS